MLEIIDLIWVIKIEQKKPYIFEYKVSAQASKVTFFLTRPFYIFSLMIIHLREQKDINCGPHCEEGQENLGAF